MRYGLQEKIKDVNPIYPESNKMPPLMIKNVVNLLRQHSISTIWEQAYRCPCLDVATGQPQPNCPICHGQGWIYLHPRRIDMAIQGDQKRYNNGETGMDEMGSSQATPQISVNSVEQGIKPGDRITVEGWTTNETYTFNVNEQRLKHGIFLPYDVQSINEALIIDGGTLTELDVNKSFTLKENYLYINDEPLLDKTISLSLEIVKRFYVVSMLKELRYEQYINLADKLWATGNGTGQPAPDDLPQTNSGIVYKRGNVINNFGDFKVPKIVNQKYPQVVNKDGARVVEGKHQVYRMPPLLLIRRENLYFSNVNLVSSETDNKSLIHDPRVSEFDSFMSGE